MTPSLPPVTPADLERAGFVFLDKVEARLLQIAGFFALPGRINGG